MLVHTLAHPGWPRSEPVEGTPAVVALHGHGAHAHDLLGITPFLAGARVAVVCPEAEFMLQPGVLGYTWFDREPDGSRSAEEFERVAGVVEEFVDFATERYRLDPARTVLAGFSQGGTLAYRLGLHRPERYRGVAALSTWLPDEAVPPLEEGAAAPDALRRLPVLVQHGAADPLVGVERAREARDRLTALGLAPEYHEYAMEHSIAPQSLKDLSSWLERVLDLPSTQTESEGTA